jgi:hypothetical protein
LIKSWIKILFTACFVALLWTITPEELPANAASACAIQGEYEAEGRPLPITDEYGFLSNAPVQIPALTPTQSSRLVSPAKYRLSSMRTNILRRCSNRLSANIYTPIAATGRLVIERISAPLRHTRAVHFYVFELCRLLC